MPLLCVQWKTADDGQRNCPKHVEFYSKNKFEKLVHLVGFIVRIYHDARSPERPIYHDARLPERPIYHDARSPERPIYHDARSAERQNPFQSSCVSAVGQTLCYKHHQSKAKKSLWETRADTRTTARNQSPTQIFNTAVKVKNSIWRGAGSNFSSHIDARLKATVALHQQ